MCLGSVATMVLPKELAFYMVITIQVNLAGSSGDYKTAAHAPMSCAFP